MGCHNNCPPSIYAVSRMTPTKNCQRGFWIGLPSIIPRGRAHEHIVVLASFSIHPDDWAQARGRTSDTASGHREAIIVVIRGMMFRITEIKKCDKALTSRRAAVVRFTTSDCAQRRDARASIVDEMRWRLRRRLTRATYFWEEIRYRLAGQMANGGVGWVLEGEMLGIGTKRVLRGL